MIHPSILKTVLLEWVTLKGLVYLDTAFTNRSDRLTMGLQGIMELFICPRNCLDHANRDVLIKGLCWLQAKGIVRGSLTVSLGIPKDLVWLRSLASQGASFPIVKELKISSGGCMFFEEIGKVFPAVEEASCDDYRWTWWASCLRLLPQLKVLRMCGKLTVTSATLSYMSGSQHMQGLASRVLRLNYVHEGDNSVLVAFLCMFRNLEALCLECMTAVNMLDLVNVMPNLKQLKHLNFVYKGQDLTDQDLAILIPYLYNLQTLSLRFHNFASGAVSLILQHCLNLETLELPWLSMKRNDANRHAVDIELREMYNGDYTETVAALGSYGKPIQSLRIRNTHSCNAMSLAQVLTNNRPLLDALLDIEITIDTNAQLAAFSDVLRHCHRLQVLKVTIGFVFQTDGEVQEGQLAKEDWERFIDSANAPLLSFSFSGRTSPHGFAQCHVARLVEKHQGLRTLCLSRVEDWNADLLLILASGGRTWQSIKLTGAKFLGKGKALKQQIAVLGLRTREIYLSAR